MSIYKRSAALILMLTLALGLVGCAAEDILDTLNTENTQEYETGTAYEKLLRTPDDYIGETVEFSGNVRSVTEYYGEACLRMATKGAYDNVIIVHYDPSMLDSRIIAGDYVSVKGLSVGLSEGYEPEPEIIANKIEID